ncbi:MAG TPA: murein biosynthesis integral membrane protein MurJ [Candidatus Hydrogenedentes bacterium]|nr:murein biosynthesis integral membrane protein MurJ [Candidatus Hydrogenedentota bacterium]HOH50077.1 murein biosynthesis integral membrane protein MurJ [Candidatus Hydrogenedentota bacterium]
MDSKRDMTRFAAVFAGGTMLSRVSGLVRDMIFFHFIKGEALGAFVFAFSLPNMLRDMLGEGATNAALIPVFAEKREKEGEEAYRRAVASVMGFMMLILSVITVLGVALMPAVPGLLRMLTVVTGEDLPQNEAELSELVRLLQWTFPYVLMICMTVFASGPLFLAKRYGSASWSPVILNVVLAVFCVGFARVFVNPAWALVLGIWVGGLGTWAYMFWDMHRATGVLLPRFDFRNPAVGRVLLLMLPVIAGQSAGEVNKVIERMFAASLGMDKVVALYASNRLVQLPLSVFGVAVSVAILPSISRAMARGEVGVVRDTLMHGFRQSFFLVFPAMVGLVALREPLVRLLFERGKFGPEDTRLAADALGYAALGLLSFSWVKVSIQGFYAAQQTHIPVIAATAAMVLNILLNIALVRPMGYLGLALSTSISYTVNFLVVYALLCRKYGRLWDAGFAGALGRMLLASLLMGACAAWVSGAAAAHLGTVSLLARAAGVFVSIGAAVGVYFGACALLRVSEMRQISGVFLHKAGGPPHP